MPIRCTFNFGRGPAASVFGDLTQFVRTLLLVKGVEHGFTVVRQKRIHLHGMRY